MPLKLYKRGKTWHYRATVAGRILRGSTGAQDRKIAEQVAAKIQHDTWKGHLDGPESVLTFAQAAIKYRLAEKQTRYLPLIEDYWKDTLVKDISDGAIQQSAIELLPKAKPATRNRSVIVPTRAVINHCAGLKLCQGISVKHFEAAKVVRDPVNLEWVEAFTAEASPHLGALCLFMFLTGARLNEALKLTWDQINFEERTAWIEETKVGNPGYAHLPQKLIVALSNIKQQPGKPVFIYTCDSGVKWAWRRVVKKAGIKPLVRHSCRHGFATQLLREGVNVVDVADIGR